MRYRVVPSRHSLRLENGMYETQMTGSIIINYKPVGEFDLVPKSYVDGLVTNIDVNKITGVVSKTIFPNYNGDFNKTSPTGEFMLRNKYPVTTGDMVITVNRKGFATKSQRKLPPNFVKSWGFERIERSTFPKNPEGLGITNAINLTGSGRIKSGIIYKKGGTRPDAPITPRMTTDFLDPKDIYQIGDIVMVKSSVDMTNTSFLKLDGSQKKVQDYKKLYDILGLFYGLNLSSKHWGEPWKIKYKSKSEILTVDPEHGYVENEILNNLGGFASFMTKNAVYICGGYRGDRRLPLRTVYRILLYPSGHSLNGRIKSIERIGDLPEPRVFSRAIVFCGNIYLIGGSKDPMSPNSGERILRSKLKEDGTIGPWDFLDKVPHEYSRCFPYLSGNRLYIIGGVKHTGSEKGSDGFIYSKEEEILTRSWCFIDVDGSLILPWKEEEMTSSESKDALLAMYNWGLSYSRTMENGSCGCKGLLTHINFRSKPMTTEWRLGTNTPFGTIYGGNVPSGRLHRSYFLCTGIWNSTKNKILVTGGSTPSSGIGNLKIFDVTNDIYGKKYANYFSTNKCIYIIGGIDHDNPLINKTSTTNKGIFYMNHDLCDEYPDYDGQDMFGLSQTKINGTFFNLPIIDDVAFSGTPYSYYIKAK